MDNSHSPLALLRMWTGRLLIAFLVIKIFPFPLSIGGILQPLYGPIASLKADLAIWFGEHLMGIDGLQNTPNGSGDRLFNYVELFTITVLALVSTLLWGILSFAFKSRLQINEQKLYYWSALLFSFYLGSNLFSYGMYKVFPLQFPQPNFWRLLEPYGESSPMGLAWTFFGYSVGYGFLLGAGEALAGLLIFFRRTRLLGTLIALPILVNIVAVNFFFDIPVKLFSSELLLINLFLLSPYLKSLINLILFNKAEAVELWIPFEKEYPFRLGTNITIGVLVLASTLPTVLNCWSVYEQRYGQKDPIPLYGVYEVIKYTQDGEEIDACQIDIDRWKYIFFEYPGSIQFTNLSQNRTGFQMELDQENKTLQLIPFQEEEAVGKLSYKMVDDYLVLEGQWRDSVIYCSARKKGKEDFLLMNRGFHWINETPHNR